MTQEALAQSVGCSVAFIGNMERGMRRPSLETLCKLADALDCSVDALLGRSVAPSSAQEKAAQLLSLALELADGAPEREG